MYSPLYPTRVLNQLDHWYPRLRLTSGMNPNSSFEYLPMFALLAYSPPGTTDRVTPLVRVLNPSTVSSSWITPNAAFRVLWSSHRSHTRADFSPTCPP